jgi:hypothetical protein
MGKDQQGLEVLLVIWIFIFKIMKITGEVSHNQIHSLLERYSCVGEMEERKFRSLLSQGRYEK